METALFDRPIANGNRDDIAVMEVGRPWEAGDILDFAPPGSRLGKSFIVMPNGLAVEGQPTREAWAEVGNLLVGLSSSVHWLIGDWLNYGIEKYGLIYDDARDLLAGRGFTFGEQTLRIDKYVAARISLLWRHNKLTWQHHKEVAALEPEQREYWLCLAEERGLSTKALRAAISGAKKITWLCYSDVWSFKESDHRFGVDHPGRVPGQVIQNLLYYYTEPGAFVIGPTDRYGTLSDVCAKSDDLNRECLSFDSDPVRQDIMRSDPAHSWPTDKNADLVFMALLEGHIFGSDVPGRDFISTITGIIANAVNSLKDKGILSILVAPQLLNGQSRDWTWDMYELLRKNSNLKYVRRLVVPAESTHRPDPRSRTQADTKIDLVSQIRDMLIFEKQASNDRWCQTGVNGASRCFVCGIRIGAGYSETRIRQIGNKDVCSECYVLAQKEGCVRIDSNTFLTKDGVVMKKVSLCS